MRTLGKDVRTGLFSLALFCLLIFPLSFALATNGPSAGKTTAPNEYAQKSVQEIRQQAGVLEGMLVETWGYVYATPQVTAGAEKEYILRGDEGEEKIVIKTVDQIPALNDRLIVKGVIKMDHVVHPMTKTKFHLDEKGRTRASSTVAPPSQKSPQVVVKEKTWLEQNMRLLIIVASAVFVLLIGITALMVFRKPTAREQDRQFSSSSYERFEDGQIVGGQQPQTQPQAPAQQPMPFEPPEDSEITIKRSGTVIRGLEDATIKYLPGHIEIVEGVGNGGDRLPLCGGNSITLGRLKPNAPKGPAFIRFEDDSRELSGKQAVIQYDDQSDVFRLEHHGLNPTGLNGQPLMDGSSLQLDSGAVITLPSGIKLKFVRGRSPR